VSANATMSVWITIAPRMSPSPIDLRSPADALVWAASAMSKRPWRARIFDAFVDELCAHAAHLNRKSLRIRHALALHQTVRSLLARHASYLVCDHVLGPGGMTNDALYMTLEEQIDCLGAAGLAVRTVLELRGLALLRAHID
jgi:hypothetical protein